MSLLRYAMKTPPLAPEEQLIAAKRPTALVYLGSFILPVLLTITVIVIGCFYGHCSFYVYLALLAWFGVVAIRVAWHVYSLSYFFTNRRIIRQKGILSTTVTEIRIADLRGINVVKPFLGRLLGYSRAAFGTAATDGAEIRTDFIRGLGPILEQIDKLRKV